MHEFYRNAMPKHRYWDKSMRTGKPLKRVQGSHKGGTYKILDMKYHNKLSSLDEEFEKIWKFKNEEIKN